MTVTAGSLSQVAVAATSVTVSVSPATAGVAPYAYQWYRSTTSGFTPGSATSITSATSTTLVDTSATLIPNTKYYYENVVTDSTASTASTSQIAITTTAPVLLQNAFAQAPFVGIVDMSVGSTNVIGATIDNSAGTNVYYPGQFVKIVANNNGGTPKVIGCTAKGDSQIGCIRFNVKDLSYAANTNCEICLFGTVVWLYATGAITQWSEVCLDTTSPGGVQATGNTATIVGSAIDGAAAAGTLIRVLLTPNPAFTTA